MPDEANMPAEAALQPEVCPAGQGGPGVEVATVFLTYLACLGDESKVAATLNIPPLYVAELAQRENWRAKVDALLVLKKERGADALAKEINRTANLVQAVRLRNVLDMMISRITRDEASFDDFITEKSRFVDNFSCEGIAKLAKACEAVHKMTYAALGDTLGERLEQEQDDSAKRVSLGVLKALAAAGKPGDFDPTASTRQALLKDATPE